MPVKASLLSFSALFTETFSFSAFSAEFHSFIYFIFAIWNEENSPFEVEKLPNLKTWVLELFSYGLGLGLVFYFLHFSLCTQFILRVAAMVVTSKKAQTQSVSSASTGWTFCSVRHECVINMCLSLGRSFWAGADGQQSSEGWKPAACRCRLFQKDELRSLFSSSCYWLVSSADSLLVTVTLHELVCFMKQWNIRAIKLLLCFCLCRLLICNPTRKQVFQRSQLAVSTTSHRCSLWRGWMFVCNEGLCVRNISLWRNTDGSCPHKLQHRLFQQDWNG